MAPEGRITQPTRGRHAHGLDVEAPMPTQGRHDTGHDQGVRAQGEGTDCDFPRYRRDPILQATIWGGDSSR